MATAVVPAPVDVSLPTRFPQDPGDSDEKNGDRVKQAPNPYRIDARGRRVRQIAPQKKATPSPLDPPRRLLAKVLLHRAEHDGSPLQHLAALAGQGEQDQAHRFGAVHV